MASPIQVVLNPENYQEARETNGGGGRKDFFAYRDAEFSAHRSALLSQIVVREQCDFGSGTAQGHSRRAVASCCGEESVFRRTALRAASQGTIP